MGVMRPYLGLERAISRSPVNMRLAIDVISKGIKARQLPNAKDPGT